MPPSNPPFSSYNDNDNDADGKRMDESALLSPPTTAKSRSFRESTYLIPTPGVEQPRPPRYEPFQLRMWVVGSAAGLMIGLAIALEVALAFSKRDQGFSVPEKNVLSRFASENFLTSFIPILLVAPLALLWESTIWIVKRYQPYLNLAKGDKNAEETIMLDYVSENIVIAAFMALARRHWLVWAMSMMGFLTLFLQPLAGSVLNIEQIGLPEDSTAISIRQIGLDPDRFQLNAFVSAAGYVQAAVANNLTDPPFVNKNWTTADFMFPNGQYLNGSFVVNTTGIRTTVDCSAPQSISLDTSVSTSYTISSTAQNGCPVNVTFDPRSASQQYGVSNVPCSNSASLNITFQPVFFWFFHNNERTGNPESAGVFCSPFIELFYINAKADLSSGELLGVTPLTEITADNFPNNVTNAPQNQMAFNGVIFELGSDNFTNARAVATRAGVSGAILQFVQLNDAEQQAFDSLDGFVDITTKIYTQHLSLVAKNTYTIPARSEVFAVLTALRPRLVIAEVPAHFLAILLIIIGSTGLIVGILHRNARRAVFLAAPPGTIASAVSLTSHSGFGQLLFPYDTEEAMRHKMYGLNFGLDQRTGAILTYDKYGAPTEMMGGVDGASASADRLGAGLGGSGLVTSPTSATQKRGSIIRGTTSGSDEKRSSFLGNEAPRDLGLGSAGYSVEPFVPSASGTPEAGAVRFRDAEKS